MPIVTQTWESIARMIETARTAPEALLTRHWSAGACLWLDGLSPEEALARPHHPQSDAIDAVAALRPLMARRLALVRYGRRREIRSGLPLGERFEENHYLAGRAECWEQTRRRAKPKRVAKIGIDIAVPWYSPRSELLARGAAALATAEWYRARGYRVELWGLSLQTNYAHDCDEIRSWVRLVRPDAPIAPCMLAGLVAEVGAFRGAILRAQAAEYHATTGGMPYGSLGQVHGGAPEVVRETFDAWIPNKIKTLADAAAWVSKEGKG
jgi:hypothetical protein